MFPSLVQSRVRRCPTSVHSREPDPPLLCSGAPAGHAPWSAPPTRHAPWSAQQSAPHLSWPGVQVPGYYSQKEHSRESQHLELSEPVGVWQYCGSGQGSLWIRIDFGRIQEGKNGRPTKIEKCEELSCFEVLD